MISLQCTIIALRMFPITLEPVSFTFSFGRSLVDGAQITTDLLLHKICESKLQYPEDICSNLNGLNDSSTEFNEVQKYANNFYMIAGWITNAFGLFYACFVGSLVDTYGYKFFLLAPTFGMFIGDITMLLNYLFIDVFPFEIFYLEDIWAMFGGSAVFYLCTYGYVTQVTVPSSRASTLARVDGFEVLGTISGTLLSPLVLDHLGAMYCYIFKLICTLVVFVYVFIRVKKSQRTKAVKSKLGFKTLLNPLVDLTKTIFVRRPCKVHYILAIQFGLYAIYCSSIEERRMKYLYLQKVLDGFTGSDDAYMTVFITAMNSIGLLIILPLLSHKLKLHDALIQVFVVATECMGYFLFAFSAQLWQVYGSNGLIEILGFCKYSIMRSIASKCVHAHETGKTFSFFAILVSIFHIIGSTTYRQLYNVTVDVFPAASILLKGMLWVLCGVLSFVVYCHKWRIDDWTETKKYDKQRDCRILDDFKISHM